MGPCHKVGGWPSKHGDIGGHGARSHGAMEAWVHGGHGGRGPWRAGGAGEGRSKRSMHWGPLKSFDWV